VEGSLPSKRKVADRENQVDEKKSSRGALEKISCLGCMFVGNTPEMPTGAKTRWGSGQKKENLAPVRRGKIKNRTVVGG